MIDLICSKCGDNFRLSSTINQKCPTCQCEIIGVYQSATSNCLTAQVKEK
jgi:predicted Zn-ribbon and HTH transcriptional regulator